jgi:hypothetical protein
MFLVPILTTAALSLLVGLFAASQVSPLAWGLRVARQVFGP